MEQLLSTKFFIPPTRPELVPRPRLIERLNEGLHRKLTLISAPAGFGKTTLITEWLDNIRLGAKKTIQTPKNTAWLSLDAGDNDPKRFLLYFITALSRIEDLGESFGKGPLGLLQSPQTPPIETCLIALINELAAAAIRIIFVLDDYHVIESSQVDDVLTFLLENSPPQLHLIIATREDPIFPLSRLYVKDQITEIRASDLRFTTQEAADFLNQVMDLNLSADEIAALETRTEGWIAGLQLAAISLQGQTDATSLIHSFTASNRLVLDYLIEEVLSQQAKPLQTFWMQTSLLDRLCGPLCDALSGQEGSQRILENLDRANLFIVPLDKERHWYRYHHLFADLLRKRLHQRPAMPEFDVTELHSRASEWYENNGLDIEAFQHAAAANDVARASRLIESQGVPLQHRGAVTPVLNWLSAQPAEVLDARPSLWVTYASALNLSGQPTEAEQKLQAAEAALLGLEADAGTKNIIGYIASIRAMIAVGDQQLDSILAQSRRALEYLPPDNLPVRTIATWTLGYAYQLQGDREAASQAYTEVIANSQKSGDIISTLAATTGLGNIQESKNQLYLAVKSYQRGMELFGEPPQPIAVGTYLGQAQIYYEWNDLETAEYYGQLSLQLAQQLSSIDTTTLCAVLLARLKLAHGDAAEAAAYIEQADRFMRQHNFMHRIPDVATAQVDLLLHLGDLAAAAEVAEEHELPLSMARAYLAQGEFSQALTVLAPLRQEMDTKGWEAERLKVLVLQAIAHHAQGEMDQAIQILRAALALAEPGGMIRTFVDEGPPMARLLYEALSEEIAPGYIQRLLAAFPITEVKQPHPVQAQTPPSDWVEPLSQREIEVLHLIAEGLTNQEIASRLYLSLHTVKGHTRNIFGKLGVKNRVQAAARGKSLGILPPA